MENYRHDIRPFENINMIVSTITNIYSDETIYVKYLGKYIHVEVGKFRYYIYALSLWLTFTLMIFILFFIKYNVLNPIIEITQLMKSSKATDSFQKKLKLQMKKKEIKKLPL